MGNKGVRELFKERKKKKKRDEVIVLRFTDWFWPYLL